MILFKKWAKHKVKSYIYYVNQFLKENAIKMKPRMETKTVSFVQFM